MDVPQPIMVLLTCGIQVGSASLQPRHDRLDSALERTRKKDSMLLLLPLCCVNFNGLSSSVVARECM